MKNHVSLRTRIVDTLASPRLLPAREAARTASRRVRGGVMRGRMAVTRGSVPGLLSIVVPMYNVERYIGECLESLMRQNYARVQIIVVDDGSPDRSYEVARRYARRDPRIEIVRRENGGLSAARNTGMQHARGEFLAFLDSDDFVDRHAYSDAIDMLRRSGSDFAVMPYRRELGGEFPPAGAWIGAAHEVDRVATTLSEFPDIMVNAVAWSKVYRREFWERHGFQFPVGLLYEDQAVSMAAYAAADAFDVLSRVSLNWRIREDRSSITQSSISAKNLHAHHIAVRDSLENLEDYGALEARDIRITHILNNNFGEFLVEIRRMSDEAWAEFSHSLHYLSDLMTPALWRRIEARKKVMIGLCAADRRDLALRFLEQQGWDRDHFGGPVAGDRILAELPMREELRSVLPDGAFVFSDLETPLEAAVRDIAVGADGVELSLFAHVNHLRIDVDPYELELVLVAPDGTRSVLAHERVVDARSALGFTRRYAEMAYGAVRARIPFGLLDADGVYGLEATISSGEFVRTGVVMTEGHTALRRAEALGGAGEGIDGAVRTIALEKEGEAYRRSPALLRVERPAVVIEEAAVRGDRVALRLASERPLTEAFLRRYDDRFALRRSVERVRADGDGRWAVELQLPPAGLGERGPFEYVLTVQEGADRDGAGEVHLPSVLGARIDGAGSRVHIGRQAHRSDERSGGTLIVDLDGAVLVTNVSMPPEHLSFELDASATAGDALELRATGANSEIRVEIDRGTGLRARLPLLEDRWGLGPVMIGSGRYEFSGRTGQAEARPYLAADLAARLPIELRDERCRIVVERDERGIATVDVLPPRRESELGGGDVWRMRDWSRSLSAGTGRRSVLFRNRYGEEANDSALAVHRELQRRGSDLELIWAVKDHSVRVPEGGRAVIEESREYFEAFGTANYVMVNVHQPDWFRKSEGQVLIETHHGYPFKLQGRRWWDRLGFGGERQESFFTRAEEWDYLVSPARYATEPLMQFYREDAQPPTEILEIGYPRNDALLDDAAPELRRATRERLGIAPGTRAVLYAPTYRDALSSNQMSAQMVDFLDAERLVRELGDGYVLLMRGHPFNAGTTSGEAEKYIDVTDYPDINHLILASDLAILDYSSLRFDYALTGKPSLFYVPDRESYFAGRESFVPYEETSPGPYLTDQAALTAAIRDADRIGAAYEQERLRFVREFMELEDGHAAARLVDRVFVPRGDA